MAETLNPPPTGVLAPPLSDVFTLPAGQIAWRLYFRKPFGTTWRTFRRFGPTSGRFDHHRPPPGMSPDRAILYAAENYPTCFAEAFQSTRVIDRWTNDPHLAAFTFRSAIPLLDVTGSWPTRAGASMTINSGSRAVARHWSRRIHAAFPELSGILYASSMDGNRPAYAFYERAQAHIEETPVLDLPLSHSSLRRQVVAAAHRFGYRLV